MSGTGTIEPVLVEGIDQVLLIRLYPEAEALSAAGDAALAQGVETAAAGAVLEGSQYEPVLMADAEGGEGGGPDPVPTTPPINVDVPHVQQAGSELTCTMGNWEGMQAEPHSYAYQWQLDGADITGGTASLPIMADDVGKTATCVVTASNAIGSTAAPPSNGVVVTAP
jgi:hypothetical protein